MKTDENNQPCFRQSGGLILHSGNEYMYHCMKILIATHLAKIWHCQYLKF